MSSPYQGNAANITQFATSTITYATNATPISITTSAAHNYASGDTVVITGITGNTAANGTFVIIVTSSTSFTLTGSVGNGAYVSGGTAKDTNLLPFAAQPSNGDVFTVDQLNTYLSNLADKIQFLALAANANETIKSATFLASGSWTVPSGVTNILAYGFGGGGGGGSGNLASTATGQTFGGGGAGAGSISNTRVLPGVKPGDVLTVTIGTGGAVQSGNASNGFDGNPSTVVGSAGSLTWQGGQGGSGFNPLSSISTSTVGYLAGGSGPAGTGFRCLPMTVATTLYGGTFSSTGPNAGLMPWAPVGGAGSGGAAISVLSALAGWSMPGMAAVEGFLGGVGGTMGQSSAASWQGGGGGGGGGGPRGVGGAGGNGGLGVSGGAGASGANGSSGSANTGSGGGGGGGGGCGSTSGGTFGAGGAGGTGYVVIIYVAPV